MSKMLSLHSNGHPVMTVAKMLNKNTWGVKKCEANQKQHCKQACATKNSDIRVTLPIFNSLNDIQ